MATPRPHTEAVQALIASLDRDRAEMLKLAKVVFGSSGGPMFPLDLLAAGAAKRNLSVSRAICALVEARNMTSARALLRVHIDTALRFSAAWLVEKPHEFATAVIAGERIDKLRCRDGKRLSDAYLVERRSQDHPWLPAVYKELSGYVHFSGSHFHDAVREVGDDSTFSLEISDVDDKYPESSWIEVLECSREATAMLAKFLQGYAATKQLTQEELEAGRANRG